MLNGILAVLEELRIVTGVAEARAPFDDATYERMVETAKKIIDDNFADAVAKGNPELAGSWVEILDALTAVEPQTMRDSKTVSAETMRVRKTLAAQGYLFYKAPGQKFEFVYAPDQTPDHAKIAELKDMRKKVGANLKASATPEEKADNKKALKDVDQQIKDLQKSPLMQASEAAVSKARASDEPAAPVFQPSAALKGMEKDAKAIQKKIDAATDPKAKIAAEKELAALNRKIAAETADLEQAQGVSAAGEPAKKGSAGTAPSKRDGPPGQAVTHNKQRIGGYEQTAQALDAVDAYEKGMLGALDVLSRDPELKKFDGDRRTRLANLIKTLEQTVLGADREMAKVGASDTATPPNKKVAEEVKNA